MEKRPDESFEEEDRSEEIEAMTPVSDDPEGRPEDEQPPSPSIGDVYRSG